MASPIAKLKKAAALLAPPKQPDSLIDDAQMEQMTIKAAAEAALQMYQQDKIKEVPPAKRGMPPAAQREPSV